MTNFRDISITELAGIVAEHLAECGIEVVLVGGLAVEIYTENLYLTKDIDMVNTNYQPTAKLHAAMELLGFYKQGRVYVNDSTAICVEFPSAPLSVGDELVKSTTKVLVNGRHIPILTIQDIVKDRLSAFIHWRDNQSLVQATALLIKNQLSPEKFKAFFDREGGNYALLLKLHRVSAEHQYQTMKEIEQALSEILIKQL
ncbi:nucleotidyltransferase [Simiduia agarivorans]|uniref:Uncharacterized protein n=1 Tax=Simiduia agarivorans (strain DSM 21679 / JCM 13881 / BCRC 17597 / SA1) TaxID=1117647 RepID=K4KHE4_SIMAS|nr:nucleotidyltransferase [Simiduia agarivorans]AFU98431.1 hypothetical protein M5M_06180 [Simiduia agarivorans SA1 = DSM 21679]